MKIVTVSDSFKGTLTSKEVGMIVSNHFKKQNVDATFIPISDGGEGFLDTLLKWNKNLKEFFQTTCDAFRRVNSSKYLFDKDTKTLYFELAECVGIKNLKKEELNEMLKDAKEKRKEMLRNLKK